MTRYWDSWHTLSTNPENNAVRTNLRELGVQLSSVFQNTHSKLTNLRQDINDRIATAVNDINSVAKQVASLNGQISAVLASGQNPNDLQDQRDLLLEGLAMKVDIHVVEVPSSGALNVYIGGQPLVSGDHQFDLSANPKLINGFFEVEYAGTGGTAQITGGSLKALVDMRNTTLSDTDAGGFIYELNQLAQGIMSSVNAAHQTGFGLDGTTGLNFFVGTDASDMEVEPAIALVAGGTTLIAAAANDPGSLAGGPGDNGNALKIAQLRNKLLMGAGTTTVDDYYKGILTSAGVQGQEASRKVSTQESLLAAVKSRGEQVSGVSTDEEMANVIRYQKAYAASARVLSTIDEMLEILLNVGR
jgi:flagellar hook-associated protein 1 FlgK